MIITKFYDIEVLKNFFSITIVDITSYLNIMKDACKIEVKKDKEVKTPIPLVQKYTVKEIKELLNQVKVEQYYITDNDDNQLLSMVSAINNMRYHKEIIDNNEVDIITHLYGYNSSKYDDLMIAALLMHFDQYNTTKELIRMLYETSQKIISLQNNEELAKKDFYIESLRKYKLPFTGVDIMTIFALNKANSIIDKNGDKKPVPKSLKQTSINIQWYELLEFILPPICEKDVNYYYKEDRYRGMSITQLNDLINEWNRYIINEYIPPMMYYNKNDCFIGCEIVRLYIDEIRLRYTISYSYKVNVLSASRSKMADILFSKFYSEFSGLHPSQWKGKITERSALSFKKVIFNSIKFKTPALQEMLEEMKQIVIFSIGKKALKDVAPKYSNFKYLKSDINNAWFEITINNLTYSIATGGLHSQDVPRVLISTWDGASSFTGETVKRNNENINNSNFVYVHYDISSFYPSIMAEYEIGPEHLNIHIFSKLIRWLRDTRIEAKHSKQDVIDGIPKNILAEALKIVINSIYGKLGFAYGDLCDRLAVLKVTINGQLMIMMLCEELELNGIEIVSANTDGIVVKLFENKVETFKAITEQWQKDTRLSADSEYYKIYACRDINNYFCQETNGKLTYKGALHPLQYAIDLKKGYDMPIVAKAVVEYFINNTPITETLYKATNILDFCKTQNIGRQFHVEETIIDKNGNTVYKESQRNCRFYVSNNGSIIEKVHNTEKSRGKLCAGFKTTILNSLDDKDISLRDINYQYYYDEAFKIINPIKLGISPALKRNNIKKTKSGKVLIKKYSGAFNTLFDD